jgi:pimeloyl-ACP methyl ester carboxylesterase
VSHVDEMFVESNGVPLKVDVSGDGGPAVLLLHGWPDSSELWRYQVGPLREAGYRVIVPDLRGFGDSAKPAAVDDYAMPLLVGDVHAILDAVGVASASVVGHDWGAAVAWALASFTPERVERLACLSVGHPAAFGAGGLNQRRLSWYMLLFQLEGIAEDWLSRNDWANMRQLASKHPDLDRAIRDAARPGALTAGLNLYRANLPPSVFFGESASFPPIHAPTLAVWSSGDGYLTEEQMTGSRDYVASTFTYHRLDGASHWMQLDAADELNHLLLKFLA